jgi:hypothetical protein
VNRPRSKPLSGSKPLRSNCRVSDARYCFIVVLRFCSVLLDSRYGTPKYGLSGLVGSGLFAASCVGR